jgi:hypothetical protein
MKLSRFYPNKTNRTLSLLAAMFLPILSVNAQTYCTTSALDCTDGDIINKCSGLPNLYISCFHTAIGIFYLYQNSSKEEWYKFHRCIKMV